MYAIVQLGSHQYKVSEGDAIDAQKLDVDFPVFNLLGTMPGTDIWDELVKNNILDEDKYWEEGVHISDVDPNGVPTERISNLIL